MHEGHEQAEKIAKGVANDPVRLAEMQRHFEAINAALNKSHVNGEQDALCVFEAMGCMLGQLVGALSEAEIPKYLSYVLYRAESYATEFRRAGKAATHVFERGK